MEVIYDTIEMKVSAKRMWKAVTEDAVSVMPKAAGDVIEKVEYEGNSFRAGAIRTIHFHKSIIKKNAKKRKCDILISYARERLLDINPRARTFTAKLIDGAPFGELLKEHHATMFFEETGPNTSVLHYTLVYDPICDEQKDHIPHILKEGFTKIMRGVEAFLVSHHD